MARMTVVCGASCMAVRPRCCRHVAVRVPGVPLAVFGRVVVVVMVRV